ncbi:hypothetical protein N7468_000506 [Penicillium chermesinum]|uniref:Uncharacterized protein n=1 Tax=Penicillium chermesinum TaxID=63820 RepID=A0A9W9PMD5_9EURO|nr:uncharacterized protein N7468_000506 [Penicillium chermesinum]KAJ5249055.1 hypothetical protein N7468_000506 [Penicillium chermesinum]KAJ6151162.1 hypothetical protein N7470_007756 [Penicillium chermesinum]
MNLWPLLRGKHRTVYLGNPRDDSSAQHPPPKEGKQTGDHSVPDTDTRQTPTSPWTTPTESTPQKVSSSKYVKPSIAAATIVGIIFVAGGVFLLVWYIRQERRARRLRVLQSQNPSQDPFCQSTLTLNEDSDRNLNEFLMKDLQPERRSMMFNQSLSPSFPFLVDDFDHTSTSTPSLSKPDSNMTLTPGSTETTVPPIPPEKTPNAPPAPRLSIASTAPPTARSSQLWTTTTGTTTSTVLTELSSLLSNPDPGSSRTSQSTPRVADEITSSVPSSLVSHLSTSSHVSSRRSPGAVRAEPQAVENLERTEDQFTSAK